MLASNAAAPIPRILVAVLMLSVPVTNHPSRIDRLAALSPANAGAHIQTVTSAAA
jgi:hypothetical protein